VNRVTGSCDARAGLWLVWARFYGLISTGVSKATSGQISSISSLVTAIQPSSRFADVLRQPSILGAQSVNLDVTAVAYAEFAGVLPVVRVGIGSMKRTMELAGGFLLINNVQTFRRFVLTDALFGSDGLPAERDLVRFQHRAATHQRHRAFALFNDDAVGLFCRLGSGVGDATNNKKERGYSQEASSVCLRARRQVRAPYCDKCWGEWR
jgi:hypothetical protein